MTEERVRIDGVTRPRASELDERPTGCDCPLCLEPCEGCGLEPGVCCRHCEVCW